MTPEQINIAIAEFCGLERDKHFGGKVHWHAPDGEVFYEDELPDYYNDLNAIHAALALDKDWIPIYGYNLADFVRNLGEIVNVDVDEYNPCTSSYLIILLAKPAALCEALLKTIGKWKDETFRNI
jgi:hypothetical protein